MKIDGVKKMIEEKDEIQNKARMIKPPQVETNTWRILQHPKAQNQELVLMINRTQQRRLQRKYTLWKEFSVMKYKKDEIEKEDVSENTSKPNPRFD